MDGCKLRGPSNILLTAALKCVAVKDSVVNTSTYLTWTHRVPAICLTSSLSSSQVCVSWWPCCWTPCPCWGTCCCSASLSSLYSASWASSCGPACSGTAASLRTTSLCEFHVCYVYRFLSLMFIAGSIFFIFLKELRWAAEVNLGCKPWAPNAKIDHVLKSMSLKTLHSDEWEINGPWNNEKDPMMQFMVDVPWAPMTYSCSLCHPSLLCKGFMTSHSCNLSSCIMALVSWHHRQFFKHSSTI